MNSSEEVLDEAAAWKRLLTVRSAADAEAAGIVVSSSRTAGWRGRASSGAELLAQLYSTLCIAGPQLAFAQLGQSLDGFIATRTGDSDFVTGEEDRRHLHRLRALADAVVVGAGTAVADDPLLTVRACEGANPVRVVLDPRGRVPLDRQVFSDPSAPTLWLVAAGEGRHRSSAAAGVGGHVEVLELSGLDDFAPAQLLKVLAARGLGRVLVEGGGVTVSRFLHDGALSRLYVTVAPVLIGDGVPGLRFNGTTVMRDALRPPLRRFELGADSLFEFELGSPSA
ncbi:RibD family protein [Streptomyces sp. 21So2-11]|uniref:RibD family protein n=1 Tax=Streptomyces sp. 21So2-11 TaxID=3144408 RepID=UPI00321C00FD